MLHVYINILNKLIISNKKFQIINFCFFIALIFCEKLYAQDNSLLKVFNDMNPKLIEEDWFLHDPSRVINFSGGQMIASTGKAQEDGYHCGLETWIRSSPDKKWEPGQCLFIEKPSWVEEELPENDGAYWAPELLDQNTLFYSVSDFEDASCVGLAFASGTPPKQEWKDFGEPLSCIFPDNYEYEISDIDPSIFKGFDDNYYLVTGGGVIHVTKLDENYFPSDWFNLDDGNWKLIARGPIESSSNFSSNNRKFNWVEASFIFPKDNLYYLFVNWGACCSGVDSTYNIRIGRSQSPFGPYLDKEGKDMLEGGGSLFFESKNNQIGPGHSGIRIDKKGRYYLSYHYYDRKRNGLPWIGEKEITWNNEWPEIQF